VELTKRERIQRGLETNSCPGCGRTFTGGPVYGTGAVADGRFCGLRCFSDFHGETLAERARMLGDRNRDN
jgi:hypothetical protein